MENPTWVRRKRRKRERTTRFGQKGEGFIVPTVAVASPPRATKQKSVSNEEI